MTFDEQQWPLIIPVHGLVSVAVVLILWLLRLLAIWLINHQLEDVKKQYRWRKIVTYSAVILGLLIIGLLWLTDLSAMAAYLGLISAGLMIALQSPLTNLAGWLFIVSRRPFEVGDRIQIGSDRGDVIDIRPFQFSLLEVGNWVAADQSTGRILHVPNSHIFSQTTANYSQGFQYIWDEIPVQVTFESNWRRAKTILQEVADRHTAHLSESAAEQVRRVARRYLIFYPTLTPTVYTKVEASGVLLTVRYLCEPRRRRSSEQAIWEDVLDVFANCSDIEFAYPTQRHYHRWLEEEEPLVVSTTSNIQASS